MYTVSTVYKEDFDLITKTGRDRRSKQLARPPTSTSSKLNPEIKVSKHRFGTSGQILFSVFTLSQDKQLPAPAPALCVT